MSTPNERALRIGRNLRRLRRSRRWTQAQVAKMVGITKGHISNLENGHASFGSGQEQKYAEVFGCDISEFYRDVDAERPTQYRVPLISWVRAGLLSDVIDNYQPGDGEDWIPTSCADPRAFALRVSGDSMTPVFSDGDVIVVSPSADVLSGHYAVVKYGDESTLKKVKIVNGDVHLIPENDDYHTMVISGRALERYRAVGRVVQRITAY